MSIPTAPNPSSENVLLGTGSEEPEIIADRAAKTEALVKAPEANPRQSSSYALSQHSDDLDIYRNKLGALTRHRHGYVACCPFHHDTHPSLHLDCKNAKWVWYCHVCELGGGVRKLLQLLREAGNKLTATYDYTDASGRLAFQSLRFEYKDENGKRRKTFKQRRPDGKGGWLYTVPPEFRTLYNLPAVLDASHSLIIVVEGEKDVDTAKRLQLVGTTNPMGAGKWMPKYSEFLRGKDVVIIPDADEPGERHKNTILESLLGKARSVKVIRLPGAKDLTEWVEHGGIAEDLESLIANSPALEKEREHLSHDDSEAATPGASPSEMPQVNTSGSFDDFPFTDTGNAERLVTQQGRNFRWLTDEETFVAWNDTVWERSKNGDLLLPITKEVVRGIGNEEWRRKSESAARRRNMIAMTKGETSVLATSDFFDQHRMLLNVKNGTLDLEKFELRQFRREDFLTKKARVAYDSAAKCPRFDEFLNFIFGGCKDTIQYMLKALSYTLTGSVSESCFFICYGLGANGKTTLIEVLMQMLGPDYARPAKFSTFVSSKMHDPKYELATFKGARLVTAVEPRKAGHFDEEVLKQITGGDQIMARDIYSKNVTFYPEFKLWLAMNNKPRIEGTDEGIWRRVRFLPFNVQVPPDRQIKDFHKVLFAEEGPGILNRLLEGLKALRKEGLVMPTVLAQATSEFRATQNLIQGFFDDCTVQERGVRTKAGHLYACYRNWAEKQGEHPMRNNEFAEELERRGFEKARVHQGYAWAGIKIKEDSLQEHLPVDHLPDFVDA